MILIFQAFYTILLLVNNKYFHKNNSVYLYVLMGIISPLAVYLLREKALTGYNPSLFDQLIISSIWFLQSNFLLYKAISNKISNTENFTNIIYLFAICAFDITLFKILSVAFLLALKINKELKEKLIDYQSIIIMILVYFINFSTYPISIYIINVSLLVLLVFQLSRVKNDIDFLLAFSVISLIYKETQMNYYYFVMSFFIVLNIKFFVDKDFFNLLDKTLRSIKIIERLDIVLKRKSFVLKLSESHYEKASTRQNKDLKINYNLIKYKMDYKLTYFLFGIFALYILMKGAITL